MAFCSICVQASLFPDFWRDGDGDPATRLSGRAWTCYCLHPPQKLRRHSLPQGPHLCVRHIKIQVLPQSAQGHNFSGLLGLVFELEEVEETDYDIEDQLGQLTRLPRPAQRSLPMGEGLLTEPFPPRSETFGDQEQSPLLDAGDCHTSLAMTVTRATTVRCGVTGAPATHVKFTEISRYIHDLTDQKGYNRIDVI